MVIKHGAHLAEGITHDEAVARSQGAVLHQYGSHGAAAAVKFRLNHCAHRGAIRTGLQITQVRDQADHLQQQIEILLLLRRDIDENCRTSPRFRNQPAIA